jgi:23S rRNA pseudouridine1911/1915/1917 synthase
VKSRQEICQVNEQQHTLHFPGQAAQRLDHFLVAHLPEFSRSRLQSLIKEGRVLVDGVPAHKSGQLLEKAAQVEVIIPPPAPTDLQAEDIPLEIVFENEDVLVINKAAGMVVHPAAGHAAGTLINAALGYDPDLEGVGGEQRPGLVHRLDRDTSGLIILARNDHSHQFLQDQFRLRKTEKTYIALVDGFPPTPTGRIEAAIGRSASNRNLMAVVPSDQGRAAVSEYLTLESFARHALLEVHPQTGRTHQIRVHLAFIGCPVAGDTLYGRRRSSLSLNRHFLHAARLSITLPGEDAPRTFHAPLPAELEAILAALHLG